MKYGFLLIAGTVIGVASLAAATGHAETVLNIGMQAQDMQALDPHRASTTPDKAIVGWMFNGLILVKGGLVIYTLTSGQPSIVQHEENTSVLGPVQALGQKLFPLTP